eukprot:CAMPEP_0195144766 /NCGR_PEP_ID=MMETSP0448-20130528/168675_1 /TAXON_ID=66468 /ORGANISM="Heterocapsa triquestra, Strain CCMP 448" /LENGTH=50 /DNA_ID=CAMNT_0040183253 /DNA_START=9 /DNA_END=158 /DNA_ORIENTATION=-
MKGKKVAGKDATVQMMTAQNMAMGSSRAIGVGSGDIASRIAVMAAEHNLD